jgi:hypothetical protein
MRVPSPENAAQAAGELVEFVGSKWGFSLPYTSDSLATVDTLVERVKGTGAPEEKAAGMLFMLGCYVGEVFVRAGGGRWRKTEELGMSQVCSFPIAVELPQVGGIDPIGEVFRRFRNSDVESLAAYYAATVKPDERSELL